MRKAWLVCLFGVACATSPTGRNQLVLFPEDQMSELGVTAFADVQKQETVSQNTELNTYVRCIAEEILAANMSEVGGGWEISVFESDQVNAFALPGKKIGVYSGMVAFADNADQLAAVIGHEVGHVIAQHGNERMSEAMAAQGTLSLVDAYLGGDDNDTSKQLIVGALGLGYQFGLAMPHSRTQESEADTIGLVYLAKAGFDPTAAVNLWEKMAARGESGPEFLSTHPAPTNLPTRR